MLTTQAKTKRITRYAVIIGGACLLMSQKVLASALFEHIVQPYVATALTYDANVLRLPDNFTSDMTNIDETIPVFDEAGNIDSFILNPTNNKTTKSSFIRQMRAGLAAKWQISQQQLVADVSIDQNWFSTYKELDYTGHNILGQWNWQIGKKLKGELTYNQSKTLASFEQINRLVNNLENNESYVAKGTYDIFPDWYLRAGFTRISTRYPTEERQASNLREVSKEFGLGYLNNIENMLGFSVTMTDGEYTSRDDFSALALTLDNAYTRINYDLNGVWNYSVKTRIRGQIGYVSQEFKHLKNRNFFDVTSRGDILWLATAKSSLFLEGWREISQADDLTASFQLNQGVKLTPTWLWSETPLVKVELPMSYEQQDNLGVASDSIIPAQKASQIIVRLNLSYTPIPNVEMTTFAAYEDRHSTNPLHSYQDQLVGFTMKVSF